jgi:DNA-binding response OmpR family regulator
MSINILLVEDEIFDCISVKQFIEEEGLPYKITNAGTIKEAVACLTQSTFDLALVDYNLPDGSGLDVISSANGMPCIFISQCEDPYVALEILKAGADDFIVKDIRGEYIKYLPSAITKAVKKANEKIKVSVQLGKNSF